MNPSIPGTVFNGKSNHLRISSVVNDPLHFPCFIFGNFILLGNYPFSASPDLLLKVV